MLRWTICVVAMACIGLAAVCAQCHEWPVEMKEAMQLYEADKYPEAIVKFESVLKTLSPEDAHYEGAKFWLACAYKYCNYYASAEKLYRELLLLDNPKEGKAHVRMQLATCLFDRGAFDEAIAELDISATDPARRVESLLWKAEILCTKKRDYAQAVTHLRQMIAEFPDHPTSQSAATGLLAVALSHTGGVEDAVAVLKSSLPKDATLQQRIENLSDICHVYRRADKYAEAAACLEEQIALAGDEIDMSSSIFQAGECYAKLGNRAKALVFMNRVIERYPDTEWAGFANGYIRTWAEAEAH